MANIEIKSFVEKFGELLDDTDVSTLTAETSFRDIEEWSSLTALTLIAMADDEYSVKLTGDDIRSATTLNDLMEIIGKKMA